MTSSAVSTRTQGLIKSVIHEADGHLGVPSPSVFVCNSAPQDQTVNSQYRSSFLRYQHDRQLGRISQHRLKMSPSCIPLRKQETSLTLGLGKSRAPFLFSRSTIHVTMICFPDWNVYLVGADLQTEGTIYCISARGGTDQRVSWCWRYSPPSPMLVTHRRQPKGLLRTLVTV